MRIKIKRVDRWQPIKTLTSSSMAPQLNEVTAELQDVEEHQPELF